MLTQQEVVKVVTTAHEDKPELPHTGRNRHSSIGPAYVVKKLASCGVLFAAATLTHQYPT